MIEIMHAIICPQMNKRERPIVKISQPTASLPKDVG
jgi:hypothetical protein